MTVATGLEATSAAERPPASAPRVRTAIAVLVTRFPRIDETFILREINELERNGQPVVLVPLLRDHGRVVHEEAKPWMGRALYMPLLSGVIVRSNLRRLIREPRRYLKLLGTLIVRTAFRPAVMFRTLALFPKSVYLADLLPRLGVRHLHAHFAVHPTTMAYIVSSLSGVSYSFTVHGPDVFVHRLFLREKIRRAKFVRAVSAFVKAYLTGLYPLAADGKIDVVHIGVNPDVYGEAARESDRVRLRSRPRLVSVASLTGAKGFSFVVDACKQLVDEGVDLDCIIVGEGPQRGAICERIAQHGLTGHVRLTGALPQHEVVRVVAECDIFVLPSVIAYNGQMDGIPISLMEAMAARRPVVASSISGIPELVQQGVSGFLVDATHPERIAGAVRRLLEDRDLRERMGAAGEAKVRQSFDVRRTAADLIALFDRHDRIRVPASANIRALSWEKLNAFAIGLQRIRELPQSFIAELTMTDGVTKRDVVVKQQRERDGESRGDAIARAEREFAALTRMRAAMSHPGTQGAVIYSVPRVLLFDEPNAAIIMERATGKPLGTYMRAARNRGMAFRLIVPMRRAGLWLARMQDVSRSSEDGRHLLTALLILTERDLEIASLLDRRLRKHREAVLESLRNLEQKVAGQPLPVVAHHGDFRPQNIFVGPRRIDVIDFEASRDGLPLEDVASFLVHLNLSFRYPLLWRQLSRLEKAFLTGYDAEHELDPDALELFMRMKALQLLARGDEQGTGLREILHRRALRDLVLGR